MAISQANETSSLLPKTGKALSESEILNSATPLTPAISPPGPLTADADAEEDADSHAETEIEGKPAVWTVISILLSGVLLANADTSLIVASSQQIASEFDSLSAAAWLITTYILAQCAFQPLVRILSTRLRACDLTVDSMGNLATSSEEKVPLRLRISSLRRDVFSGMIWPSPRHGDSYLRFRKWYSADLVAGSRRTRYQWCRRGRSCISCIHRHRW